MEASRRSPRRALALLLVLALAFPGCIEALDSFVYAPRPDPEAMNEALLKARAPESMIHENVTVLYEPMTVAGQDGIALWVDVWRPENNSTVPVILMQSPYFGRAKQEDLENRTTPGSFYDQMRREFVHRGYAVALADLRGTRLSDGCVDLGGNLEQTDAARVVEALAALPWSNGRIGMIGGSYDGWTQLMAAVNDAPHLEAIVPIAPVADWYHVMGKGGAKYVNWMPGTPLLYNILIPMGMDQGNPPSVAPDPDDPIVRRADDQGCVAVNQVGSDDPSGAYNAFMKERDLRPKAPKGKAAMFFVHGLLDENARPDHIAPFYNDYGGPKRAFLWQMPHTIPNGANTGRGEDWLDTVVAWFDHHLLGLANGVNATYGTVEVQDSLGRWRNETAWPPEDATPTPFPLESGRLHLPVETDAIAAATETWKDSLVDDGGPLGRRTAVPAQGNTEHRLVFLTSFLKEDVHYAGRPAVDLLVSVDRPQALVVARLYEILPDGSWILVNRGVQSLLLRDGLDNPSPALPLSPYALRVEMQPGDHVFRAGRAIGLTLTSSDASYVHPMSPGASTTIHYGGENPSALVLPLVERDAFRFVTWGPQQPAWVGPHAWEVDP